MNSNEPIEEEIHGGAQISGKWQEYLGEIVYGGIDGSVTTFAVVAGSTGAGLDISVILILGFANLLADGFSMSVGAFLSAKSKSDNYKKHRKIEYYEIENFPEHEKEEIRQIFREKGFEGELLEKAVDVISSDKDRWVDMMMKDELEMIKDKKSPFFSGLVTFLSFLVVGFIPLFAYVFHGFLNFADTGLFFLSCVLTSLGFFVVGFFKSYVNNISKVKGIIETLALGWLAAVVAYFAGDVLARLF